ncbi:MAG TPA: hypothetical protein VJ783_17315 [Pirellulales bacterium]|nr:hypothetical protein [Pirellulales bacterium]
MARAIWSSWHGRPIIEVNLVLAQGGQPIVRRLIADTGAGTSQSRFDILLDEYDCLQCGATPLKSVALGGAYIGSYPTYAVTITIPALGIRTIVSAVAFPRRQPASMESRAFDSWTGSLTAILVRRASLGWSFKNRLDANHAHRTFGAL